MRDILVGQERTHLSNADLHHFRLARERPAMYVGSVDEQGLLELFWEMASYFIEAVPLDAGAHLDVILHTDGSFEVASARSTPALTRGCLLGAASLLLHPDRRSRRVLLSTLSPYRLGLFAVAALSTTLAVRSGDDDATYLVQADAGVPIHSPWHPPDRSQESNVSSIRCWSDPAVFADHRLDVRAVRAGIETLCCLHPGLTVRVVDVTSGADVSIRRPKGLEYLLSTRRAWLHDPILLDTTPNSVLEASLAFVYVGARAVRIRSYVNGFHPRHGGTHHAGLLRAVAAAVQAEAASLGRPLPPLSDAQACRGLRAVLSVRMGDPQFSRATKTELANPEVTDQLVRLLIGPLRARLGADPEILTTILDHLAAEGVAQPYIPHRDRA